MIIPICARTGGLFLSSLEGVIIPKIVPAQSDKPNVARRQRGEAKTRSLFHFRFDHISILVTVPVQLYVPVRTSTGTRSTQSTGRSTTPSGSNLKIERGPKKSKK